MDRNVYAVESQVEDHHWWFVGRRRLFARYIRALPLTADAPVLDVGTGTGTNLRMLRALGFRAVVGLDSSDAAIDFCTAKGLGPVHRGDVCALPFEDEQFSLALASDVIEHVDDDAHAVRELARVLIVGGHVLITVPAFQVLWGGQDERGHHRRRYRLGRVVQLVEGAGLSPIAAHYFNYVLFLPILIARRLLSMFRVTLDSENVLNTRTLNAVLTWLFGLDVTTAALLRPPFGVSGLVLARKERRAASHAASARR